MKETDEGYRAEILEEEEEEEGREIELSRTLPATPPTLSLTKVFVEGRERTSVKEGVRALIRACE